MGEIRRLSVMSGIAVCILGGAAAIGTTGTACAASGWDVHRVGVSQQISPSDLETLRAQAAAYRLDAEKYELFASGNSNPYLRQGDSAIAQRLRAQANALDQEAADITSSDSRNSRHFDN